MKKLMAVSFFILCLFSTSGVARAEDSDVNTDLSGSVYISAVNYDDNNEYVVLTNSGPDVEIDHMTLEFFEKPADQPNLVVGFSNGIFLAGKSIIIGKSTNKTTNKTTVPEVAYSDNQIMANGGLRLNVNDKVIAGPDICWGSVSCNNHFVISDSTALLSLCLMGSEDGCSQLYSYIGNAELKNHGWQPKVNTDPGVTMIYSDEELAPPVIVIENPDCRKLQINEIGANLDEQFIELGNGSNNSINLKGCVIKTNRSSSKTFVFGNETLAAGALRLVRIGDTELTLSKTVSGTVYIMSNDGTTELQSVTYPAMKSGTSYWLLNGVWKVSPQPSPGEVNYLPPTNYCRDIRISEIAANVDEQFVEIVNNSGGDVNLQGCRIMTNRSTSNYFAFGGETLPPNAFRSVKISDTNLTLTKTTSGTVYLTSSDGETEMDSVGYADLDEQTSWSLVDGVWAQTYKVTAGAGNIYQEYPSCGTGYYRNTETGRCNKIAAVQSAILTPCKAGYERNPLTNRCRKIATATSSSLKACAEGYERNPETNRCRKIVATTAANYALETTTPTGNSNNLMLASAGIFGATLLVVAIQYRMEIANGVKKLSSLLSSFVKSSC